MWKKLMEQTTNYKNIVIVGEGYRGHVTEGFLLQNYKGSIVFADNRAEQKNAENVFSISQAVSLFPMALYIIAVRDGRKELYKQVKDELKKDSNIFVMNGTEADFRTEYEKQLYGKFKNKIEELREISAQLKPADREECFDRYYINDYVKISSKYIKNDVLEFAGGNVVYALKYGNNVNLKLMAGIMHKEIYPHADYFSDLDDRNTLPDQKFDCIIATQVIMYVNNVETALKNLRYMLKPGGTLILTVPGPLFHHSKNSHHMFSFTEDSLKFLCEKVFGHFENFKYYGSLEYVFYMLFWMKKNPYLYPGDHEYLYTLVMGITVQNSIE